MSTTLYKVDSEGNLRVYCIRQTSKHTIETVANGKTYISKDPNPEAFIKAKIARKKGSEGWCDSIEDAKLAQNTGVMLAAKCKPKDLERWWNHNVKKGTFMLGMPKLNGIRGTMDWNGAYSREGNCFDKLKVGDFLHHSRPIPYPLDGELYAHGYPLEEIVSMVKGNHPDKENLKFYIFDQMVPDSGVKYIDRLLWLPRYVTDRIHVVSSRPLYTYAEAKAYLDECDSWCEGMILRNPNDPYLFGRRNKTITKVKYPITEEFIIHSVARDRNNLVLYECKTKDGKSFMVVPTGTKTSRSHTDMRYARNIGAMMTVEFYEYTKDGKPRHASGIAVRNYE